MTDNRLRRCAQHGPELATYVRELVERERIAGCALDGVVRDCATRNVATVTVHMGEATKGMPRRYEEIHGDDDGESD